MSVKMAGQTINDRLLAARHSIAGQGLAKSVCKATTEEMIGPKRKHLDCECPRAPFVSDPPCIRTPRPVRVKNDRCQKMRNSHARHPHRQGLRVCERVSRNVNAIDRASPFAIRCIFVLFRYIKNIR